MDELQHVLDNLGDGQKWAKRLLSLGLEPQDVAHLGPFHPRCQKTLACVSSRLGSTAILKMRSQGEAQSRLSQLLRLVISRPLSFSLSLSRFFRSFSLLSRSLSLSLALSSSLDTVTMVMCPRAST
jgi:hypothetical protein